MEPILIELPARQISELAAIADAEQSTLAEQIRRAVESYVAQPRSLPASECQAATRRRNDRRDPAIRPHLEW